jgi:hypothetical protein
MDAYSRQAFGPTWQYPGPGTPQVPDLSQQTAPFSDAQNIAMHGIQDLTTGAPMQLANQGAGQVGATMGGNYFGVTPYNQGAFQTAQGQFLGSNPYLNAMYGAATQGMTDQYKNAVAPGIMAAAQQAGQMGSSAMGDVMSQSQRNLGTSLGNMGAQIYGGSYEQERNRMQQANQQLAGMYEGERGRQMQSASMVPQMQYAQYAPYQALYSAGAQQQQQAQDILNTGYQNRVSAFEQPYNILSGLGSAMLQAGGGGGGTTTSTTTTKGGGGSSVICTELFRQGMLAEDIYLLDSAFGEMLSPDVIRGYHLWGKPLARVMARFRIVAVLIAPVARIWALHVATLVSPSVDRRSFVGGLFMRFGVPFNRWLGRKKVRWQATM